MPPVVLPVPDVTMTLPPAPVSQRSVLENLVLHAHSLWRGKDYDKAIVNFDRAIEADPK